jgi:hypothetical protein
MVIAATANTSHELSRNIDMFLIFILACLSNMMSLQKGGGARQIHNHQLRAANHLFVMEHHSQREVSTRTSTWTENGICAQESILPAIP